MDVVAQLERRAHRRQLDGATVVARRWGDCGAESLLPGLYPAAAATCCAGRESDPRRSASNVVAFVLGIAVAMAALGLAISLAGRITGLGSGGRYLAALVPLLMGVHLLGWVHLPLARLRAPDSAPAAPSVRAFFSRRSSGRAAHPSWPRCCLMPRTKGRCCMAPCCSFSRASAPARRCCWWAPVKKASPGHWMLPGGALGWIGDPAVCCWPSAFICCGSPEIGSS